MALVQAATVMIVLYRDEELNWRPNENFQCLGTRDILELERKGRMELLVEPEKFWY